MVELGVLNVGPDINLKFWSNVIKDWPHSFNYWLCGRYSPTEAETSLDYSKRLASELERVSSEADMNTLDLYVTHDMVLMAALFHWFGVFPGSDHIGFLNGFLMQRSNDRISLFVGDSRRMVGYPYW
jgi:broad specificity phosphatase PhoE